jgi:serine/threonine protein kinase
MMRLDDFAKIVGRSGLIATETVARVRDEMPESDRCATDASVRLARRLIDRGDLTSYQARKLLAGVTKGFFLGAFTILRRLGEGGMGKVYLAVDRRDGRKVAIKVLPPKKALESEQALLRFRREMDLSRRVQHPNIARTLEVGDADGVHYMVMEYIPGDSLYHMVKGSHGPLRVPDAARYFHKVLDGLAAAHAAGLVHRDIKPSNLMITPEGDARILDLGLARAMGDESPLTRPNVVMGTLDYASPEQLSDAARADARSDLYSIGCTLYFTLTGRAPFEGGDVVNKIYKQKMEDPEPVERVSKGVPQAFGAIVRKLMAKDPAERYQSAAELRDDLDRWIDPARVRAILGAEAETARAFRPPPPELDDDDLRLVPDGPEGPSSPPFSLRDLGEAEVGHAPMHKAPPPPRPALIVPDLDDEDENEATEAGPLPWTRPPADDWGWLVPFMVVVGLLGLLAIILIAALT